jgi:hypothetical protein
MNTISHAKSTNPAHFFLAGGVCPFILKKKKYFLFCPQKPPLHCPRKTADEGFSRRKPKG